MKNEFDMANSISAHKHCVNIFGYYEYIADGIDLKHGLIMEKAKHDLLKDLENHITSKTKYPERKIRQFLQQIGSSL